MKERPILFSAPMIRALLADAKTQTRRIKGLEEINLAPGGWKLTSFIDGIAVFYPAYHVPALPGGVYCRRVVCPYGKPGDRLWGKETFFDHSPSDAPRTFSCVEYRAEEWERKADAEGSWRSPVRMPRWASRILLEITNVRAQRLQDIREEDAKAEGLEDVATIGGPDWKNYAFKTAHPRRGATINMEKHRILSFASPIDSFRTLWCSINGQDSWELNPWIWAISFRKLTP